jgi:hypothetical protein
MSFGGNSLYILTTIHTGRMFKTASYSDVSNFNKISINLCISLSFRATISLFAIYIKKNISPYLPFFCWPGFAGRYCVGSLATACSGHYGKDGQAYGVGEEFWGKGDSQC